MCGIHFVVNSDTNYQRPFADFMKDAFIANQVRGTDSTGMFQVKNSMNEEKKRPLMWHKVPSNASVFLAGSSVKDMITATASQLLTVGHVRHATYGGISQANAHPFIAKRDDGTALIGVHNGSLTSWRANEGTGKFSVDSEWLFNNLAEKGTEAFKDFDGAFALIWYDSAHPNHVFIARNDQRPLFYGYSKTRKSIIGCSELGMLGWLAERNKVELYKDSKGTQFFYPEEGYVFKINLLDPTDQEKIKFPDYVSKYTSTNYNTQRPYTESQQYNAMFPWRGDRRGGHYDVDQEELWDEAGYNSHSASSQLSTLQAIKDVLREARNQADAPSELAVVEPIEEVVTGDILEKAMDKAINNWFNKRQIAGQSYVDVVFSSTTTGTEVDAARQKKLLGMVVDFVGYFADPDTSEVYGDFRIKDKDGKELVFDSIVRAVPSSFGDKKYVKPTASSKMIVVGCAGDYCLLEDFDPKNEANFAGSKKRKSTVH